MTIQSVIFDKERYSPADCLAFLRERDLKPIKRVHETAHYYRYRLTQPLEGRRYKLVPSASVAGVRYCMEY